MVGEWIEWKGGDQPVPDETEVEVCCGKDGYESDTGSAIVFLWEHTEDAVEGDYHIVRYRVVG